MGQVVVPDEEAGDRRWCVVLTNSSGFHAPGAMARVAAGQIVTALVVPLAHPVAELTADRFARVWLAQVQAGGGNPSRTTVARALAGPLREPDRRVVVVDAARRRLINAVHIRHPVIITRTLTRLLDDGFLEPLPPPLPTAQAYRLVLRHAPWNLADGADL
ncbi:hypothetical protein [Dactylosporangium darangshiense]|uniref:hypothetical protein n=1 Tax=Dactylosporangium darangshiense TaxID=579108 RepID=UPI00363DD9C3